MTKGGSLKLGTLYEYRRIEDPARRDVGEGTYKHAVSFPSPIEVDKDWLASMLVLGSTREDPFVIEFASNNLRTESSESPGRLMVSGEFDVELEFFNCYVLCASVYDFLDEIERPFADASDYWLIPARRRIEFMETIADSLRARLHYRLIEEPNYWPIRMVPKDAQLDLRYRCEHVTYSNRVAEVRNQSDLDAWRLAQRYSDCPFIKPIDYSHEKEFRFVYILTANGRPVPIVDEPMYLEISPIPSFVKSKAN